MGAMETGGMILRCIECGHQSATGHRWRAYLTNDPNEDEPSEVAVFCPSCAEREFGGFGKVNESIDDI